MRQRAAANLITLLVVAAVSIGCASDDPRVENILMHYGRASTGETVYSANCARCHGQDLRGTGDYPNLVEHMEHHTKRDLATIVLDGSDPMPAFADKLSDRDIADVAEYVMKMAGHH